MEPRRGGLPVRLTYFVTPYDLIDPINRTLINLTINSKLSIYLVCHLIMVEKTVYYNHHLLHLSHL